MSMQNRRSALLALAAAGCAAPVLITAVRAQTTATQNADYADYVSQTLTIGAVSLQTSQVASEKATDPMVKEFAMLEVGEQAAVASVLSATETGAQPPEMPEDQMAMVTQMTDMEAGAEFDRMYIEGQIDGHNQLLEIQRSIAADTEPTVEVVTARLAEQAIMSHLAMLAHIQATLDQAGGEAGAEGSDAAAPAEGQTEAPATGEGQTPATGEGGAATGGDTPAPAEGAATGGETPAPAAGGETTPAAGGAATGGEVPAAGTTTGGEAPAAGTTTGGETPAAGTTTGG